MHKQKLALTMIASASLTLASAAMAQQQTSQPSTYQGVSQPPQDVVETTPDAKPSAAVVAQPAPPPPMQQAAPDAGNARQTYSGSAYSSYPTPQPLMERQQIADPDGDIVHPQPAGPGQLMEGATIRVRLSERLSSTESEKGEPFHGQVASDVLQNGRVLIPAGSGIEGRVTAVSAGHFGGHGSFRLRPEAVILPDGSRYALHAETTGTPGSKTRIGGEGSINPGSRAKKDGIEYGSVVGAGAITGAVLGGPVGALTGSLVGAGIVTTHLMVDHPQATLEPGSVLLFTLTEPMNLTPFNN
ncbi:DUF456 domain-containing protein [Acidicapsa ligni]|uniref:DUF456 domain-containing protein n=1 Tax=Acidicapsa ligni TaxID=542300 RepID=UPI0021E077C2|nr:DUF456 domain-containing protein [Acidicapsa ligni]